MGFFNTVKIRTPESVELELPLAGIGNRAVALAIDYVILTSALLVLLLLWIAFMVQLAGLEGLPMPVETLQLWLTAGFSLLMFALYIGYFVGFETYWYGQTPGKRYAGIRVIRDDAQPARLLQSTLRSLLRPIDEILFIGFFCILFGKREKRIGDWLAGTLVVQTSTPSSQIISPPERTQAIAKDLLHVMDFAVVSPDDFAVVKRYLQRRPTLMPKAREEVSLYLAGRLREKAQLESLPTEMTADVFLEAVYWAYQQQKKRDA